MTKSLPLTVTWEQWAELERQAKQHMQQQHQRMIDSGYRLVYQFHDEFGYEKVTK